MPKKKTDYKPQMSEIQEEDIQDSVDAGAGVPRLRPDEMRNPLYMGHLGETTQTRSEYVLHKHGFFDTNKNKKQPEHEDFHKLFRGNSDPDDRVEIPKMVIDTISQPYSHKYSPMVLQNASNELSPAAMQKITAEQQRILALEAKLAEERRLADIESEFSRFSASSYTPNLQASQSLREKYEDSRSAKRLADWWRETHSFPALPETEMDTSYQPMPTEAPPALRETVMQYYGIE